MKNKVDDRKTKKRKKGIARLIELAGKKGGRLTLACFMSVLASGCRMIPYFAIYRIIYIIIMHFTKGNAYDPKDFINMTILSAGGAVGYGLFSYVSTMVAHGAAFSILYDLRIRMMDKMGRISPGYYATSTQGALKKLLLEDVEQLEIFIAHSLCEISAAIATPLLTMLVLFVTEWRLALVSLIPIIFSMIILATALVKKEGAVLQKKMADTKSVMEGTIIEYIHGMPVLKIFGRTRSAFRRFEDDNTSFADAVKETAYFNATGMGLYYAFFGAEILFLLPAAAMMFSHSQDMIGTAITVIFFLVICAGMKEPLENMITVSVDSQKINQSVERIDNLLDQPEIMQRGEGKDIHGADIEFENVEFSYDDTETPAIRNVSFKLKEGTLNALVGPSGGGKSTIAKLIMHFYEISDGSIKIGGTDIRDVKWNDLVKNVAYVFQDSFLFNDTIANNIKLGRQDASMDEVIRAAKEANIHDRIESLPKGYDTVYGSEVNLSGGEIQRVAIARAILTDAPIVILDEATAYADAESETKIQEAFSRLAKGKTVIMIAHRLKSIENADNIMVIKEGELADMGTHAELMSRCETYVSMVKAAGTRDGWRMRGVMA